MWTALVVIIVLVAATTWMAWRHSIPRVRDIRFVYDVVPDRPHPFGYKMAWIAVKAAAAQDVVDALGVDNPTPSNWQTGVGAVYDPWLGRSNIFVSPPVDGWVFVLGLSLPHPMSAPFSDTFTPLLLELGQKFQDVQYFFSYPVIDFFAWARVRKGRLQRIYATGEEGVVINQGPQTREEKQLGLKFFELRGVRERDGDTGGELLLHPTEDHVINLAARWSIDPTRLDQSASEPALGFVGLAPRRWRATRIKLAA